jgi:hypothetical protein
MTGIRSKEDEKDKTFFFAGVSPPICPTSTSLKPTGTPVPYILFITSGCQKRKMESIKIKRELDRTKE